MRNKTQLKQSKGESIHRTLIVCHKSVCICTCVCLRTHEPLWKGFIAATETDEDRFFAAGDMERCCRARTATEVGGTREGESE